MADITVGGIQFTLEWRGRVVEKPASVPGWGYLSYPSVMLDDDNRYKMWFASWPHDFIYYAESETPFGTYKWDKDEQAITPGPCDAEVPRAGPFPPTCSYVVKRYKLGFGLKFGQVAGGQVGRRRRRLGLAIAAAACSTVRFCV
jgi:hypothetical protein